MAALADALQASRSRVDATQLGVEIGDRSTFDLLDAQDALPSAQLAFSEARVVLLIDRLRLASLAGQADDDVLHSLDADLAPVE